MPRRWIQSPPYPSNTPFVLLSAGAVGLDKVSVTAVQAGAGESIIPLGPDSIVAAGIQLLHLETGLSYAASIALLALGLRSLFLPMVVNQFRNMAILETIGPKLARVRGARIRALLSGDRTTATYYKLAIQTAEKAHGASMWKNFRLMLAFAPISVLVVSGLRTLWIDYPSVIQNESLWWIPSLASPDPLYLLPLATSLVTFTTMMLGWKLRGMTPGWKMTAFIASLVGVTLLIGTTLPAVFQLYFLPLMSFTLVMNLLASTRLFRLATATATAPVDLLALNKIPVPALDEPYDFQAATTPEAAPSKPSEEISLMDSRASAVEVPGVPVSVDRLQLDKITSFYAKQTSLKSSAAKSEPTQQANHATPASPKQSSLDTQQKPTLYTNRPPKV